MDDLGPLNHRKRKADSDDCQDNSQNDSVNDSSTNAPRQPWLTSDTDDKLWSPQVSSPLTSLPPAPTTKRPRIDTLDSTLHAHGKRCQRRSPTKLAAVRHGSDIEDIGIVSTADPGPSTGSLLRGRSSPPSPYSCDSFLTNPTSFVDFNSSLIPAMQPLINRQTLKELELDAIFRNPQLRHDLLFDSNLQFRPRRKREPTEKYWDALWEEIQTGCTCVSFDAKKKLHPVVCVCAHLPMTPTNPIVYRPSPGLYTLRMPSRIPALLSEFLEVLLLVIQPLSTISGLYVNANTIKEQMEEHAAQAAYIRTIFDPCLITQELKHRLFDPSGLFTAIGDTLKRHCAPMRDRAVEEMIRVAQQPGVESFKAIRSCLELLELMKLDIANHQLNQLRPLLIRTSTQFELKIFNNRFGTEFSLHNTREWLHNAQDALHLQKRPIFSTPAQFYYDRLPKDAQIYTAVLKGIVDMVFDPSNLSPPSSPTGSPPPSPMSPPTTATPLSIPETLHLDKSRLSLLSSDATDITALYMLMLLFRQLVFVESPESTSSPVTPKIDDRDILSLKREIRDIGPSRLGGCFLADPLNNSQVEETTVTSQETWGVDGQYSKRNIVLQVAKRAHDNRHKCGLSSDLHPSSPVGDAPDQAILGIAERWADTHMHRGAPLAALLHNRMRDVVFDAVIALTFPPRDSPAARCFKGDFLGNIQSPSFFAQTELSMPGAAGMEALTDEIRRLAEKIARLALIHLNAYLSLYEVDGFFENRASSIPGST